MTFSVSEITSALPLKAIVNAGRPGCPVGAISDMKQKGIVLSVLYR